MSSNHKDILRIALPSIVSNITVPLLGLIDVGITGHLGKTAYLGAIAVGGMLFNVLYWMFAFLRMGTSGMTAQAYGRDDEGDIRNIFARSLSIALFLSLAIIMASPAIRDAALAIISPEPEVASLAKVYFNICIFGAPASLCLFAVTGWLIGMQNSRIPMVVAIAQNVINILLSLYFVYVCGMKVDGIALGTVSAQWAGLIIAMSLTYRTFRTRLVGINMRTAFRRDDIVRFFNINRDIFFRTLCLIAIHFFFISAGARFGTIELAVNTLLMQLFTLYSYFMDGFAYAGEALAGKAYGRDDITEYRLTRRNLFVWGLSMAVVFTVLYAVLGGEFISLLSDDTAVISCTRSYQHWTVLIPLCSMAAFIWDGIYIGTTRTRSMLLSTFGGLLIFFLLYLLLSSTLKNDGLWIAFNAYLLMRGVILTITEKRLKI
ncbi:MAG: MATE family efflux transporter [Prevotella sp.]